jgi:hypothetical protein
MTSLSPLSAFVPVPYQHRVSAVARVAPVNLNLDAPVNPYPREKAQQARAANAQPRPGYSAAAASAGFAAQILVEAGLAGQDPFASSRRAKAYAGPAINAQNLRLIA